MRQYQNNTPWMQISYIDWGTVMGPRLFPDSCRIKGDIGLHHGFEAPSFYSNVDKHLVEQE